MDHLNITFRPLKTSDLEALVKLANHWEIAKNLTDQFPHPYTEESGRAFIQMTQAHDPARIMAIIVDGSFAGAIGVHPKEDVFRTNAELGYWLAMEYWGKGIMTYAVEHMTKYAFETFDINRLYARPFGPNIASQKVLEKAGFIKEAHYTKTIIKNGEYLDELVYAIRRNRTT